MHEEVKENRNRMDLFLTMKSYRHQLILIKNRFSLSLQDDLRFSKVYYRSLVELENRLRDIINEYL